MMANKTKGSKKVNPKPKRTKRRAQAAPSRTVVTNPRGLTGPVPVTGLTKAKTHRSHHAAVCSLMDPFCTHSLGARIPDGSGGFTVPFRTTTVIPCAAVGNAYAVLFAPDSRGTYYTESTDITNGEFTFSASLTGDLAATTFFTDYVSESRVVSAGARYIPTMSSTATPPLVTVSELNDPSKMLNKANINSTANYGSNRRYLDARSEFCCVARRQDNTATDYATVAATASTGAWTGVLISFNSAPTSVFGYLELIVNWECALRLDDSTKTIANSIVSKPPPANNVVLAATKAASQSLDTTIQGTVAQASNYLAGLAKTALDDVISDGFALLGL